MMDGSDVRVLKGYTLVEMAVVLVIAGIALGAILQGQEMIENAKIKSVISDFDKLAQAHYAYIKRVGSPPGVLRDSDGNITRDAYSSQYFADLFAEGFVSDLEPMPNTGFPVLYHAYGGWWTANSWQLIYNSFNAPQLCANYLPLFVARAIDEEMDDGNPSTGRVMTRYNSTYLTEYEPVNSYDQDFYVTCRMF